MFPVKNKRKLKTKFGRFRWNPKKIQIKLSQVVHPELYQNKIILSEETTEIILQFFIAKIFRTQYITFTSDFQTIINEEFSKFLHKEKVMPFNLIRYVFETSDILNKCQQSVTEIYESYDTRREIMNSGKLCWFVLRRRRSTVLFILCW